MSFINIRTERNLRTTSERYRRLKRIRLPSSSPAEKARQFQALLREIYAEQRDTNRGGES